jgi:hypothetical protein
MVDLLATLTCPFCGKKTETEMPIDYCQIFFKCPECGELIKPKEGDCCVFCSYADKKCPPKQ